MASLSVSTHLPLGGMSKVERKEWFLFHNTYNNCWAEAKTLATRIHLLSISPLNFHWPLPGHSAHMTWPGLCLQGTCSPVTGYKIHWHRILTRQEKNHILNTETENNKDKWTGSLTKICLPFCNPSVVFSE